MQQTDDGAIFTPGFRSVCLAIVFGTPFLAGATLLVIAWILAANDDGVGDGGVHDLLLWGTWLTGIGLAGLIPAALWRAARRTTARLSASGW